MTERRRTRRGGGAAAATDQATASFGLAQRLVRGARQAALPDGVPSRPRSRAAVVASVVAGLGVTAAVATLMQCAGATPPRDDAPPEPAQRTTTRPDIPAPWMVQRYANVPAVLNCRVNSPSPCVGELAP